MGGSGLEIIIFNVKCRLNGEKNQGRKLVPRVSYRGKKPVPFEEYIPLYLHDFRVILQQQWRPQGSARPDLDHRDRDRD